MDRLRVLILDGDIVSRRFVSEAVECTELGKVKHIASNAQIALEWLKQTGIDVVLADISIVINEGMQVIKRLKSESRGTEIVIMSTSGQGDAAVTLEALRSGALDFILKPAAGSPDKSMNGFKNCLNSLFTQIKVNKYVLSESSSAGTVEGIPGRSFVGGNRSNPTGETHKKPNLWKGADLILIASSTGGPQALEEIFERLPAGFDRPVLVVQHMPPDFTRVMANSLEKRCRLKIYEAFDSAPVSEGHIAIAPGGMHMTVEAAPDKERVLRLHNTPFVNGVKPSADVLFRSAAETYKGKRVLAVILTGMGNDGTSGVAELKEKCSCYCITQSEKTCVVYGMPGSVCDKGLSDEVADIGDIAGRIIQVGLDRS